MEKGSPDRHNLPIKTIKKSNIQFEKDRISNILNKDGGSQDAFGQETPNVLNKSFGKHKYGGPNDYGGTDGMNVSRNARGGKTNSQVNQNAGPSIYNTP